MPTFEETSRIPTTAYPSDAASLGAISASAVSWGAIFAGAAAAAGLSLILLIVGSGLGFATTSPWSGEGINATTFGVATIIWIIFMAFAASAVGGYIAGRLRTKWVGVHTNEVYFRDTAHGFLAWSVATLATAAFLGSVTGAIVSGGVNAGASMMGGVASTASATASRVETDLDSSDIKDSLNYFVDSLFRRTAGSGNANATDSTAANVTNPNVTSNPDSPASAAGEVMTDTAPAQPMPGTSAESDSARSDNAAQSTTEVVRIFMNALRNDEALPQDDVRYVAQLIAEETDLSQEEAEARVTEVYGRVQTGLEEAKTTAKEAADKAREMSAYASLWFFVSLLIGAFSASLAATFGGRQRDL